MLTGTAAVCGMTVYLFLTWLLDISELKAFLGMVGKLRQIRTMFKAPTEVIETSEVHV